ncbi:HlyC/CorC family transporter [Ketobacter sp. MCCC 1A13808]|uniref:HlyC/CorC family transporter n=1 Tax=Ketobacter sp. MCCC 1A13808 TaxID=2602738 RepID=UPI000F0D5F5B|nr:HlyC/CorC family transporter [Ketobacter sp. MCCC 1A13808]MVF14175.1 HlyC/CorC family transporter [Ketobacter sp. MCCC 1A13808]RLP54082.1 MAG: HlyC/CorC family transporter [Ketobacter sp.]
MNEIPVYILFIVLAVLILMSAFFSSSETGMMSLNRYRLRHMVKSKNRGAMRVDELLNRPDRLIGVILIGNNFVNILASSIATIIAIRLWGDGGIAIATGLLTLVILVFAEVTPKTLAALKPERIAFPASLILKPLLVLLYPFVWLVNAISNGLLRVVGINTGSVGTDLLSREELRTIVTESGAILPTRHKGMMLSILDLEEVTVDDIMIPKHEVIGIDLEESTDDIVKSLQSTQHTRLPVYKSDLNAPVGVLHLRKISRLLMDDDVNKAKIMQQAVEPYFVPEGTPLHMQLVNFQKVRRRMGFVVDEYGDVQGIVTLEDILEEIVGEFTTDYASSSQDIHPQEDGSYIIDGRATIRDINKALKWHLPTKGPKTLNGLITEHLETIPEHNLCFTIGNYRFETVQIKDNLVKTTRVFNMKSNKAKKRILPIPAS